MSAARALLFVDHADGLGGAEHSLLLLLAHLDRARWLPHVACPPGKLAAHAAALGAAVHPLTLPRLRRSLRLPFNWLHASWTLAQLARQIGAVALVSNTVRATLYTTVAARLARRPHLWYMRDFWLGESAPRLMAFDHVLKRLLVANARAVIANSHATARHLPATRKLRVIHNGIDLARFGDLPAETGAAVRRQHAIPPDAPLFGMVGRLRPWKGQTTFLHAAAHALAQIPAAHALIVGGTPLGEDDGYAASLPTLAAALGIADRVHFAGQLGDVRPALAALDLFVHPGAPEPFGLVNVEAQAAGLPVVAFAHGALPEIIADGVSGALVAPGDVDALAAAIVTLLQDAPRRTALGAAARLHAGQFDIRHTADAFAALLDEVLTA